MFNKLRKRQELKLNNHGSTMLIVMVAISLIAVLATVLMSMSYMNYNMKVTELNSKKNFYNAEIVLDQINVGLQKEISDSLEDAYVRSMQRYTLEEDVERNTNFANYYIGELRERLKEGSLDSRYQIAPIDTDGDGTYDCGLVHYLDSALQNAYADGDLVIKSDSQSMQSVAISKINDAGAVEYEAVGLILYNLTIEYTDANQYTTVINTDIRLNTPSLTLVTKTAMPNVFDYCLVADAGIYGVAPGTTTTFEGNIFAGNDTADTTNPGGIQIGSANKWTIDGESRVVSAGPLMVSDSAVFSANNRTNCWYDSIILPKSSGDINLAGSTFVRDDLTISGDDAKVALSGTYHGFGYGATAEESSAIIINGKKNTIDMSGLERLMLGGNAYIQTSQVSYDVGGNYTEGNNTNILTGNALAVKSDQIAYLVPAECIGVVNNEVKIGKNPMDKDEYEDWLEYATTHAGYQKVAFNKATKVIGKTLGEYATNGVGYKTVFRTVNNETLCYLYLDLTPTGAADYYRDYYYAAQTKMNQYVMAYDNRVLMNTEMDEFKTRGLILTYAPEDSGGKISLVNNTIDDTTAEDQKEKLQREYDLSAKRFGTLQAKLTLESSDVSDTEITKTVYENLVNSSVMNSLPKDTIGKTYEVNVISDKVYAVFVNNKGQGPYVYDNTDVRVIVATGDVNLKKDFKGLLISDGKVTVSGAAKVEPDKNTVLRVLRGKESSDEDAISLIAMYFKNGSQYSMDTMLSGEVMNSSAGQQMGELIVYENWAKQ